MKHGFIKVAAATPDIKVADCGYNTEQIIKLIKEAEGVGAKILVLPELCITGYTCSDLFLQDTLLREAKKSLKKIAEESEGMDVLVLVSLPFLKQGKLYNTAAIVQNGRVLGLVPKMNIPNYSEFYEARYFAKGFEKAEMIEFYGEQVPFGSHILFSCRDIPDFVAGVEVCEDLWVPKSPSVSHALAGACIILNSSASNEAIGKDAYRRELVKGQSARLLCAYLYADAGEGESTTDLVFSAHNIIAENGSLLKESERFKNGMILSEIDLDRLISERRRISTYIQENEDYMTISYSLSSLKKRKERKEELPFTILTRFVDSAPFVPDDKTEREKRCSEIIMMQALGLKKRLLHTNCKCAVIGVSGGLDSTLALLVTKRAFELAKLDVKGILAVTMPCFGTTDRTYHNAVELIKELGADFREINIKESVRLHLVDIGHGENEQDVTFENAQARERTQVLMDLANHGNGLVIGTGDLSELALGFATYNGDHMSMYSVNSSIPKTLVRYLVDYFAATEKNERLAAVLNDILDTPVSPELLPPREGEIIQKTEDIVGPYELHDFFLYYVMRFGFSPEKIYRLSVYAFFGRYEGEVILKWLKLFYSRFFAQQFKRSCLPDGVKVGSVAVSPRGDLRMPSDAAVTLWLKELEEMK